MDYPSNIMDLEFMLLEIVLPMLLCSVFAFAVLCCTFFGYDVYSLFACRCPPCFALLCFESFYIFDSLFFKPLLRLTAAPGISSGYSLLL